MWRVLHWHLGPFAGAWAITPRGWPWAVVLVFKPPRASHVRILIDWKRNPKHD